MPNATDHDLIVRTLAGDANAFGYLVQRHQTGVFNVCYRMMGTTQEAEDMAQEAFIRAYERLHTYDAGRPFGPWLRTVAVNLCLNKLQLVTPKVVPLNDVAELISTPEAENPEAVAVQQEEATRIRTAIGALPAAYRAVIELRHFQGLSYDAIAEQLGLSLATVKSNLFRARKQLAELLTLSRRSVERIK